MNYTVLVVEDEYDQRRAVIERVDWAAAGFEVIGEAENGVEALELLETLEPDLILTDIKMPMISGLDLAEKVREIRPATQMVILSGYDSFEYARKAINYNIISYLLKPISSSELSEELFNIKKRMDEQLGKIMPKQDPDLERRLKSMQINSFLLPLMLGSNEEKPEEAELNATARELGIIENGDLPHFCIIVSKFKSNDGNPATGKEHPDFIDAILGKYIRSFSFLVYGRVVSLAIISQPGELSNTLDLPLKEIVQTAKRMLTQSCTLGISREFTELSSCSATYFQAVAARRYTRDGAGEIRFINDQERDGEIEIDHVEKTVLKLEQLLKVGYNEELSEFVDGLFKNSTPENADLLLMQILATVYRVTSNAADKSDIVNLLSSNPIFSRMTTYNSETGVKNELISLCLNAKALISSSQKRDSEILCDRAVNIINERYSDEGLSLTEVSNELAVSPNYLSALIKKTKKKNFVSLLTEKRMKTAYDLLLCSNLKVLEISKKCGYSDQHYFSYCFKKFYGDSPGKIRSAQRGE
ncbi:MAG: response regulator [Clostridia bacterium]|nr:response regulator [Clostridia bacterium]